MNFAWAFYFLLRKHPNSSDIACTSEFGKLKLQAYVTTSPGHLHADDQGQEIRHGTRVRKPNAFISLYPGYKPYIVEEKFVVEQELCDSIQ